MTDEYRLPPTSEEARLAGVAVGVELARELARITAEHNARLLNEKIDKLLRTYEVARAAFREAPPAGSPHTPLWVRD